MGSDMVENEKIKPEDSIQLVEDYFRLNFPNFELFKKTSYTGYWWLEFITSPSIKIIFEGDVSGHFTVRMEIEKSVYYLWQYDRSVNNASLSSKANILYQLAILQRFLSDEHKSKK
jgi:hypothetical protein